MLLDLRTHKYDKDIAPFIKNGILIDTSVFKNIIDGIIKTRFSKKKSLELEKIEFFLDYIKVNNRWNYFFITPHILTEVCTHINRNYNKWKNYSQIIEEIMPIIQIMKEKSVKKSSILSLIDPNNPIIEIGDISIFVVANDFMTKHERIAILSIDRGLNSKFLDNNHVMIMDYQSNILNFL